MPLSWNEIRTRAIAFERRWRDSAEAERAGSQTFWNEFFEVFGVNRRRIATFETRVKMLDGRSGYIDVLWKGVLLVEQKSIGRSLDRAHDQARDYFHGLTDAELPKYLIVSDFARFRLYDMESGQPPVEFPLTDLVRNIKRFGFIAGYQTSLVRAEDPVNVRAAEQMGRLHDALKAAGFRGHALEVLLVRLLFCLFADDTGIFPPSLFHELISRRTSTDGADLGQWLAQLFQVLDTDLPDRQSTLDSQLNEFQYVNGKLFEESLPLAAFDSTMRTLLLEASALDWSRISPAIFGSMFQSVMDEEERHNLGAHYTSETNILKVLGPLFLDDLKAELDRIGSHEGRLRSYHAKLASLKFLDPACGCGNFLVIAYREIRLLELEVLRRLYARQGSVLSGVADHVVVNVDQFFGIEIEEFPAQIAQVALWLVDHQLNQLVANEFGEYFARLPLRKSARIVHADALRIDWNTVVPAAELDYILGNPPFLGKQYQSDAQKEALGAVTAGIRGAGVLDFVAGWYVKAASYIQGTGIRAAFVSTNSITQGEQVGVLWSELQRRGIHIQFAHRTFAWRNEGRNNAAVHCVIIGFGLEEYSTKRLFDYARPDGDPAEVQVRQLNAYLVDAPDILLTKRRSPIQSDAARIAFGSMPNDGGNLILSAEERAELLRSEPDARPYIKLLLGTEEFLYDSERYCLWLPDITPAELRRLPEVARRVAATRANRLKSKRPQTKELAKTPTLFGEIRQPSRKYLAIPEVSAESRQFIPMGFLSRSTIATNKLYTLDGSGLFEFGVLQSTMHMAWTRSVAGRLESRYQYSAGIVYNNFPWPVDVAPRARAAIEDAAQGVLDARAAYPDSSLADLYETASMPPPLVRAHAALDRAVDASYGRRSFRSEAERVAFLFQRYEAITTLAGAETTAPRRARSPRRPAR